jgi:hypothetical protein
MQPLNVVVF